MKTDLQKVFLFPIPELVFFPSANLPLNVFEERYKSMLKDSFDYGTPIAVLPSSLVEDLENSMPTSGFGQPMLLSQRDDGSSLISLQGLGRLKIERILSHEPYLVCEGRVVDEKSRLQPHRQFRMNRLRRFLSNWAQENLPEQGEALLFKKRAQEDEFVLDFLSSYFITDPNEQQKLLALSNINDRLDQIIHIFDQASREDREILNEPNIQFV